MPQRHEGTKKKGKKNNFKKLLSKLEEIKET